MTPAQRERLDELLATEATQALTPDEAHELASLLAANPDVDRHAFAYAAAAADRVLSGPGEAMPSHLAEKLHLAAAVLVPASLAPPKSIPGERPAWIAWAGWIVAAALAGVLLYTNWPKPKIGVPTPEKGYELVRNQPGAKQFGGKEKGGPAAGEVVWNGEKQEGFVKLTGLPVMDPKQGTYQLWIVDQGQKDPIDAGIFAVNPDGTAIIPVKATLKVTGAQAFAVSKESNPNGVPKAAGENIFLIMAPKPG